MKLGLSKTEYPFDYFFAKAVSHRTAVKEEDCNNADCDDDDDDDDDDELTSDSDIELNIVSEDTSCSDGVCPLPADVTVTE